MPKISIQGHCSDVAPGERVKLTVTLTRMHAHSPTEVAALMAATEQEEGVERPQSDAAAADGMPSPPPIGVWGPPQESLPALVPAVAVPRRRAVRAR